VHIYVRVLHISAKDEGGHSSQEESIVCRKELKRRLKWLKAVKAKDDPSADLQGFADAWDAAGSGVNDKDAVGHLASDMSTTSAGEDGMLSPRDDAVTAVDSIEDEVKGEDNQKDQDDPREDEPLDPADASALIKRLEQKVEAKDAEIGKLTSSLMDAKSAAAAAGSAGQVSPSVHEELAELRKAEALAEENAKEANAEAQAHKSERMRLSEVNDKLEALQPRSGAEEMASFPSEKDGSPPGFKARKFVSFSAADDMGMEKQSIGSLGSEDKDLEIKRLREDLLKAHSLLKLSATTVTANGRTTFSNGPLVQLEEAEQDLNQMRADLYKTRRQGLRLAAARESLEEEVRVLQEVAAAHDELKVEHSDLRERQASTLHELTETTQEFAEEKVFRSIEEPRMRGKVDFAEQEVSSVLRRLALAESEAAAACGGWTMPVVVPPMRTRSSTRTTLPRPEAATAPAAPAAVATGTDSDAGQVAASPSSPTEDAATSPTAARGLLTADAAGNAAVPSRSEEEAKQKADQLLHSITERFDGLLNNVESLREGMDRRKTSLLA